MTSDALASEAIEILDAEAARRIDEIRQNMNFICSSLRAQGNMTINQLLQSVRTLTMDEYCNKYHADTNFFLEELSRKRKGTELVAPSKRRDLTDAATHDSAISSKKTTKTKAPQVGNPPDIAPSKKTRPISPTKSTPTTRQKQKVPPEQQQQKVQPEQQQKVQLQHQQQQKVPPKQQQQQKPKQQPQKPQSQHNRLSAKDITNGNQMTQKDNPKTGDDNDNKEEVEFGPLFMQFLRPGHPKVTFQLDPQEELDPTEGFRLQLPYEFVDQFGPGHRRRIANQIQHIENQLETFKQRLLHPPSSRSISPSSPSPSL